MNNSKSIEHPDTQDRIKQNIEALRDFMRGDNEAIKRYTGWGGLRNAIYDRHIFCQLKFDCRLNDAEIDSIKKTLSSAYYTPFGLVDGMWRVLQQFMPSAPEAVLEPAFGSGIFVERMPEAWRKTAHIEAVEIDTLTARMTKAYFNDVTVRCMDFVQYQPKQTFDLIIGNPPFGRTKIEDNGQPDISGYNIHHYFVAKAFRMLKVGGYLAMILPCYWLDNGKSHTRNIVAENGGRLVASWRFPADMFENAKVTIDCVILQRMEAPQSGNWQNVQRLTLGGKSDRINQYYIEQPDHILGELKIVPMFQRHGLECRRTFDPIEKWKEQIALLRFVDKQEETDTLTQFNRWICECEHRIESLQRKKAKLEQARQEFNAALDAIKTLAKR